MVVLVGYEVHIGDTVGTMNFCVPLLVLNPILDQISQQAHFARRMSDETAAEARNAMRGNLDPTAHAEMVAIRHAATRLGQPRLDGCTLWVTLEPCAMCAAAIALSRIDALRFGAEDPKGGGVINGPRIFSQPTCHHRPDVLGGIGEDEAAGQLRRFFEIRRV